MRFSLFDLVVAIVLMVFGGLLFHALVQVLVLMHLQPPKGAMLLQFPWMLLSYVILTSPLYHYFHLRPLLLPGCPACHNSHRHYFCIRLMWPMEAIECANCHARIELCHDSRKCQWSEIAWPHFQLLWPYSFGGRWRRVD